MQLKNLSQQYMDYLGRIGKDAMAVDAVNLFSHECTKTINGSLVLTGAEAFRAHLADLRAQSGAWRIKLHEHIPAADNLTSILRYDIVAENFGGFHVISILRYNAQGLLKDVNEVFHPTSEPFAIEKIKSNA